MVAFALNDTVLIESGWFFVLVRSLLFLQVLRVRQSSVFLLKKDGMRTLDVPVFEIGKSYREYLHTTLRVYQFHSTQSTLREPLLSQKIFLLEQSVLRGNILSLQLVLC